MKVAVILYLVVTTMLYIGPMTQMVIAAVQMTDTSVQMMQLMNTSLGVQKVRFLW